MRISLDEILLALKARYSLIWVMSNEESRILELIADVGHMWGAETYVIEEAKGTSPIFEWVKERPEATSIDCPLGNVNVTGALSKIEQSLNLLKDKKYIFVFPDFHISLTSPKINTLFRFLKILEAKLRTIETSLIFISRNYDLPEELTNIIHSLDIPLPELPELLEELDYITFSYTGKLNKPFKEKIAMYAKGLSLKHASRIFSLLIASGEDTKNWIDIITINKKNIMTHSSALEYFPPRDLPSSLGGLQVLKRKLDLWQKAFHTDAKEYGVEYPKGLALIGIPGTGKSLTAKYIANRWQMPLLRLDMGAIFGGIVGESERNMREAIKTAEAIAPCILWIDEIEKVTQTKGLDAGTSSRVFATFLTWTQEKTRPVFVLATANDVSEMPPELLRKGRFDETFFLDIPTPKERAEIIKIHLKKRRKNPRDYDIIKIIELTDGYVGAEIEQIIKEAILLAYSEDKRDPIIEDFITAKNNTIPLQISQEDKIEELRVWVKKKRAINASDPKEERIVGVGRPKLNK